MPAALFSCPSRWLHLPLVLAVLGAAPHAFAEARVVKPAATVDVSRYVHPGLPADFALPELERCARAGLSAQSSAAGRIAISARILADGHIADVHVSAAPLQSDGPPNVPASIVPCIQQRLPNIVLYREPGAQDVNMTGRYVMSWGIPNLAESLFVRGRMREVAP